MKRQVQPEDVGLVLVQSWSKQISKISEYWRQGSTIILFFSALWFTAFSQIILIAER